MKTIVLLLLLHAVSTSGNKMYSWQNLTGVHEDEGIWDSLAPNKDPYITHVALQPGKTCGTCTGTANGIKFNDCSLYHRCKRMVM